MASRGAPLSEGWVEHGKGGHTCVVRRGRGRAVWDGRCEREPPAAGWPCLPAPCLACNLQGRHAWLHPGSPRLALDVTTGTPPRVTPQVCPYHAWALDGDGVLRDVPVRLPAGLLPHTRQENRQVTRSSSCCS